MASSSIAYMGIYIRLVFWTSTKKWRCILKRLWWTKIHRLPHSRSRPSIYCDSKGLNTIKCKSVLVLNFTKSTKGTLYWNKNVHQKKLLGFWSFHVQKAWMCPSIKCKPSFLKSPIFRSLSSRKVLISEDEASKTLTGLYSEIPLLNIEPVPNWTGVDNPPTLLLRRNPFAGRPSIVTPKD